MKGIFSGSVLTVPQHYQKSFLLLIAVFFMIEWLGRQGNYAIQNISIKYAPLRWTFYSAITLCIILFPGKEAQFIYFQF
jgi:hypothetical protein